VSRIDELIAELCPDGVRYEPLADIGRWYGGGTPSKEVPEFWQAGTIPWISPKDMGRAVVDSTEDYITEIAVIKSSTHLVPSPSIAMVVRSSILDRVFPTALVPISAALNQDMKAVVPRENILPGYVAHVLRSCGSAILQSARRTGGSVASVESKRLFSFRIPVPPLEVQREIVRILDQFTALEAELEAELEARRSQYAHFREALIRSHAKGDSALMGDIGEFFRGRRFTKNDVVTSGISSIHYGEIYTGYGVSATSTISEVRQELRPHLRFASTGDVVIAGVGETVEDVGKAVAWLGDGLVAIHDDCFAYRHDMNPKRSRG
jgi:type I restriction enzyme, S subunit